MNMNPAEMVANYIRLRDYIKKADEEYDKSMERPKAAMARLEAEMLKHLSETGADSLACEAGTVYRNMRTNASVKDADLFRQWLSKHPKDFWDAIDLKANKTFVKEMAEKEGQVPAGINYTQMATVGVRRS
jgi:hypothetical protein